MTSIVKKIEEFLSPDDATDPMSRADSDMKQVLDALAALHGKPIETLSPEEARQQPSPTQAVHQVMLKKGLDASDTMGVRAIDTTYQGAKAMLPVRIYRPEGEEKELPVILYFHGGGWVIADIDTYDAAPRVLSKMVNAVVISAHYRQAPEHKFPAAHEDAYAAYQWMLENARSYNGDPRRVALVGESAGGNLALATAIALRDRGVSGLKHVAAIYPVAGVDTNTPSYQQNANAKPLNKAMMGWFMKQILASEADKQDPRLDIIGKANLANLPPVTIVTADIDPLRSDGELLATKLKAAGVDVHAENYKGVTHEFFGMGLVVSEAKKAESFVAKHLKAALA